MLEWNGFDIDCVDEVEEVGDRFEVVFGESELLCVGFPEPIAFENVFEEGNLVEDRTCYVEVDPLVAEDEGEGFFGAEAVEWVVHTGSRKW